MTANLDPQFPKTPNMSPCLITAANTNGQGVGTIGTDIFQCLQAGADGTYVDRIDFVPSATTPTSTTATVARIFLSTATSGTTNSNTKLLGEVTLPVMAAGNASAAAYPISFYMGYRIPANAKILVTTHAAPAANTAWQAVPIGAEDY